MQWPTAESHCILLRLQNEICFCCEYISRNICFGEYFFKTLKWSRNSISACHYQPKYCWLFELSKKSVVSVKTECFMIFSLQIHVGMKWIFVLVIRSTLFVQFNFFSSELFILLFIVFYHNIIGYRNYFKHFNQCILIRTLIV